MPNEKNKEIKLQKDATFPPGEAGVRPRGSAGCSGPSCTGAWLWPWPGWTRGHLGTGRAPWYLPGVSLGREHSPVTFGYALDAGAGRLLRCQGEPGELPGIPSVHPRWPGHCHPAVPRPLGDLHSVSPGHRVRGCCEPPPAPGSLQGDPCGLHPDAQTKTG